MAGDSERLLFGERFSTVFVEWFRRLSMGCQSWGHGKSRCLAEK
jgi:hypothetical protein